MAKKYVNFRVGGSPYKVTDDYSVWTNDLLGKIIASKTVIQPGKSTVGHRLSDSDVVYIIVNGRGMMEVIEYMNSMEGHGKDPSQEHSRHGLFNLAPAQSHGEHGKSKRRDQGCRIAGQVAHRNPLADHHSNACGGGQHGPLSA